MQARGKANYKIRRLETKDLIYTIIYKYLYIRYILYITNGGKQNEKRKNIKRESKR